MRLKMLRLTICALLLAQAACRPQQPGDLAQHPPADARSRYYRGMHTVPRNLNDYYTKLYNGGFTPGIISSIRQSNSRPQNPFIIPNQTSRSETIERAFAKKKNSAQHPKVPKIESATRLKVPKIVSTTTKAPVVAKNRVVIKPSIFPPPQKRPIKKRPTTTTTLEPVPSTTDLKTWPNNAPEDAQDLLFYEKYTTNGQTPTNTPTSNYQQRPGSESLIQQNPPTIQDQNYPSSDPLSQPNVQEIIQWLQIPPFAPVTNSSYMSQDLGPSEVISNTFQPVFDPNRPLLATESTSVGQVHSDEEVNDFYLNKPPSLPDQSQISEVTSTQGSVEPYAPYQDQPIASSLVSVQKPVGNQVIYQSPPISSGSTSSLPSPIQPSDLYGPVSTSSTQVSDPPTLSEPNSPGTYSQDGEPLRPPSVQPKRPLFRPISEVSQNTVVHIINPMSKNPNVTVSEGNVPENNATLQPPPNVHIMFMNEGNETYGGIKGPDVPLPFKQGSNCPIITINSITKVNNTFQSKEGCTDLNIVINSQVLSTNNFGDSPELSGSEKYADGLTSTDYSSTVYESPSTGYYPTTSSVQNDENVGSLEPSTADESEGTYGVNQVTDIEYSESDEAQFSEGVDSVSQSAGGAADTPVGSNVASADRPLQAIGPAQQSSDGIAAPPAVPASAGTAGLGGIPGGGTALSTVNNDDDDDDDDFFDLSPGGIMNGMTSVFTYFTFLNPLNYGIFSFAAAPFAAMAAGILGIAAISFPYAFTSGFDFGRSSDRVSIKFRPNLEEVVNQSIHKYRNWQEWKSKRKKRKR